MKKSELWSKAIICIINGDIEDDVKVSLIEMMLGERSHELWREREAEKKAAEVAE